MGGCQLVLWTREVCGLGQGTTEVDVWRVCLGLEELIVGRHSRHCEEALAEALRGSMGMPGDRRWRTMRQELDLSPANARLERRVLRRSHRRCSLTFARVEFKRVSLTFIAVRLVVEYHLAPVH